VPENNARPRLSLLSDDQKRQVHRYALHILRETGVRVDSPAIIARLKPKVGSHDIQGNLVRLPSELVESALSSTPSTIGMYNRLGEPAFQLGDGKMRYGIGVTALYYMDPLTDRLEPFARRHMGQMVRLGHRLSHYDVISTVGVIQDVPSEKSDLYSSLEMIANTTKPLVVLVSDAQQFPVILDLFQTLVGDFSQHPYISVYLNPVTPLGMNVDTLDKMVLAIERGVPVIFSNYSMAGTSAPMTPAGILSLLLAELLGGLTISQVIKPGAPVSLGMLPNFFDMKTLLNFYDPQSILINIACAEMMEHYGLPHCGVTGSGTGWGADFISADTYWMNLLSYNLTHGGLAPFVGDTLGAKAFSPNTVVYVHELIDQAARIADGFQLDGGSAILDEIRQVGPGGSFLSTPTTLKRFKTGYYTSPIFPHWTMEKWQAEGGPDAKTVLRKYTQHLIESSLPPVDHDELIRRGEAFILKRTS
jgi:trimethylamine---corrinoid protein Co-methyltransferase